MSRDQSYTYDRAGYGSRPNDRYRNNPANFGSARSDYGPRSYGGRLNREGNDRGWVDRTSDEVSSWFGDDEAERRRRMDERNERAHRSHGYSDRPYQQTGMRRPYSDTDRGFDRRNWHNLRAGDIMTSNVASVYSDDLATYAARVMGECDCGALPVTDRKGRMVGMITDRDIAVRLVGNRVDIMHARVDDCMTDEVFACNVNSPLEECMRTMSRHKIRRVPVVDDQKRVIGIISQADIAQHASDNAGMGERRAVTDVVCAVSEPTSSAYV
jgi:CBS domain-containing protein